MLGLLLGCVFA